MEYDLNQATWFLSRTPAMLDGWLRGVPDEWARGNEGPDTWSPFDVVGHLIHGDRVDWMARTRMILEHGEARAFDPFDRFAQFEASRGKILDDMLDEFAAIRAKNLDDLKALGITSADYDKTGTHPNFGAVTLRQLLATWVVHDQSHLGQTARILAKQYATEVGPWQEYLPILHPRG